MFYKHIFPSFNQLQQKKKMWVTLTSRTAARIAAEWNNKTALQNWHHPNTTNRLKLNFFLTFLILKKLYSQIQQHYKGLWKHFFNNVLKCWINNLRQVLEKLKTVFKQVLKMLNNCQIVELLSKLVSSGILVPTGYSNRKRCE